MADKANVDGLIGDGYYCYYYHKTTEQLHLEKKSIGTIGR